MSNKSKYDGMFPIGHLFHDWELIDAKTYKKNIRPNGYGDVSYKVRCKCGVERLVMCTMLVKGISKSCGCRMHAPKNDNPNWKGTENIPGRLIGRYKRRAERREIEFTVTPDMLQSQFTIQTGTCALSGETLTFGSGLSGFYLDTNASIDRIDSAVGYVSGNIQWVTKDVNMAKQQLNQTTFITMCCSVADKYRSGK